MLNGHIFQPHDTRSSGAGEEIKSTIVNALGWPLRFSDHGETDSPVHLCFKRVNTLCGTAFSLNKCHSFMDLRLVFST